MQLRDLQFKKAALASRHGRRILISAIIRWRLLIGLLFVLAAATFFHNVTFLLRMNHDSSSSVLASPSNHHPTNNTTQAVRIAFVHPGKTGGTTIGTMLRVLCAARGVWNTASQDYCFQEWRARHTTLWSNRTTAESQLSRRTFGVVHGTQGFPGTPSEVLRDATHVMISLRNPVERVVSWFYYMHPINCFYDDGDHNLTTPTRQPYTLPDKACITKRRLRPTKPKTKRRTSTRKRRAKHNDNDNDNDNHDHQQTRESLFYETCFPTIHEFAAASWSTTTTTTTPNSNDSMTIICQSLARESLAGFGGPNGLAGHLWANYSYYYQRLRENSTAINTGSSSLRPTPPLLVVRTEHLWDDLARIDALPLVGGDGLVLAQQRQQRQDQPKKENQAVPNVSRTSHGTMTYHKDKLTPREYASLCCALQDELAVYQELLRAALNLSPSEQRDTFQQVLRPCGGSYERGDPSMETLQDLKAYCFSDQE